MATIDPFGLEASGVPPEMAAEYRGLTRQQAIAEALMKQGMTTRDGPINAGKFLVAPSPLEGLSKLFQVYAARSMQDKADKRLSEIGSAYQQNQSQQMADYIRQRQGSPAIESPPDELGGGPGREAIPGNPRQAVMTALLSRNPQLQKLGMTDYQGDAKAAEAAKLEAGRMLRHEQPSGSTIFSTLAADQRHVTPSGSAVLSNEGANQRHVTPSGSTVANIQALGPLRAAQEALARAQAANGGINTYYNTGIAPPGVTIPAPAAPAGLPPDGSPSPATVAPAERAAYDAVAAKLAAGQTGSAAPGGQFTPSATPAAAPAATGTAAPLVPGLSPKANEQAILAERKAASALENRRPSANTEKMIGEADLAVQAIPEGVKNIQQALKINDAAMGFTGAASVAKAGTLLPQGVRPKAVDATINLDNLIQTAVLPSMKSVFGANPTEGERKIQLEVAGSSAQPPAVRAEIFKRAIQALEGRLEFNKRRAESLRAGTYFEPGGGPGNQAPARVSGDAEYNALPKGARYVGPDGVERVK